MIKENINELREKAKKNRIDGGIFEKYTDFEIMNLTKKQIYIILETEKKYKHYKKEQIYESNK